MGHFDIQIRKIEAALPDINALFRSHKQYTLPSTGIYPPPDKIWESMLDTLADSAKKPDSRTPQAPVPNPEQTSSKY